MRNRDTFIAELLKAVEKMDLEDDGTIVFDLDTESDCKFIRDFSTAVVEEEEYIADQSEAE